jgi:cation diffusion facilitator family transporter
MDVTRAGVRRVLLATLLLNLFVSGAKIVVGLLSLSLSLVADGYHSLLDASNNVVGLVVAAFAYAPPDRGHPYGHRKFETAAALFIGLGMLGLAYRVAEEALTEVSGSGPPSIGILNWVVMLTTLAVNVFVSWYERREGRKLGSEYLVADAAHTRSDIYVTLGVAASFVGARAGVPWADRAVAVAIAAFIAVLAARILVGSLNILTDRAALSPEALSSIVLVVPGVRRCGSIRTRGGPHAILVDLIAYVDGDLTLREAHDVADRIEQALLQAVPEIVDVVVHVEPDPQV